MIHEKFYPVTTNELTSLSGKLTDTEIVIYFYLMAANPFERFRELDTSVIAEHLGVTRRTIQRTLKKLESLGLIELELKTFTYRRTNAVEDKEEFDDSRIAKRQQDRRGDSRIAEATVGSPERQQDRQRELEPLQDKDSEPSKTIKTIKTIQTVTDGVGENVFSEGDRGIAESDRPTVPPDPVTPSKISEGLIDRLRELEIPIDQKIREAIEEHGESRAWGAIRHIEATGETIRNKYGIFLFQIPKQAEEKPKKGLSPEFLEWYTYARGETVEDVSPELLPLDRYSEPMVRLRSRPDELIEWRRVKSGESLERCSGEALRSAIEKLSPTFAEKLRKRQPEKPIANPPQVTGPPIEIPIDDGNEELKAAIEKALKDNPTAREKLQQIGGNEG